MSDSGVGLGGLIGVLMFMLLVMVGMYALTSFFLMKLFVKAGVQDSWRAWVPVYNMMIFFKLGDLSPWLVLYGMAGVIVLSWIGIGFLFGLALAALSAMAAYRVGLKLQRDPVWVVLYVVVPVVWFGIVGLDGSRWNANVAPAPWASQGFLTDQTAWAGVPGPVAGYPNQPA